MERGWSWLNQLQHPYFYTKDQILELSVAPYMVPPPELHCLYRDRGDLRFICFLLKDQPQRAKIKEPLDFLEHLLVFDLMLSLNPLAVIEAVWPVSSPNQAVWQIYSKRLLTTGEDLQLPQGQFELTHHMLKKFLVECMHSWTFIVRMDMNCVGQVGRFGKRHATTQPTIFGDVNLDKLIVSRISVRDLMTLTQCSKSYRLRVWLFLLHHPASRYEGMSGSLGIKY
jgi:hypothetical protein